MATLDLSNIKACQSRLEQFGASIISGSNEATKFTNTIWDGMQGIATLVDENATPEEKQRVWESWLKRGVDKLLDRVETLIKNERSRSKKEVDGIAKEAEKLNAESKELGIDIEGNRRQITKVVKKNTYIVEEAQEQLETVQEEIKAEEEKIKKTVEEIQKQQRYLASPELTKEEQLEILNIIQGLTGDLTASTENIISKQEILTNLKQAVDNATNNIADATEEMKNKALEAQAQIQQKAQEGVDVTSDVVESGVKGVKNGEQAVAFESAAATASATPVTASVAVELKKAALDQEGASVTRLAGITTNSAKISEVVNSLAEDNRIVTRYEKTIGSALSDFTKQVGSWNGKLPPVITSIGSAINIEAENGMLKEFVASDIETLNSKQEDNESQDIKSEEQISEKQNNNEYTNNGNDAPEKSKLVNGLVTPNFKFTTKKFGI